MESVWWVVKQLWDKGLIYQDYKVMPFSTALGTVLSNFEATSNYQDVQDPAITVLFKLQDEEAFIAAWTTTPWTLPSNLALCVGEDIEYVRVRDEDTGQAIYLAAARLETFRKRHKLIVEKSLPGSELRGRRYAPLFPYFADQAASIVLKCHSNFLPAQPGLPPAVDPEPASDLTFVALVLWRFVTEGGLRAASA